MKNFFINSLIFLGLGVLAFALFVAGIFLLGKAERLMRKQPANQLRFIFAAFLYYLSSYMIMGVAFPVIADFCYTLNMDRLMVILLTISAFIIYIAATISCFKAISKPIACKKNEYWTIFPIGFLIIEFRFLVAPFISSGIKTVFTNFEYTDLIAPIVRILLFFIPLIITIVFAVKIKKAQNKCFI